MSNIEENKREMLHATTEAVQAQQLGMGSCVRVTFTRHRTSFVVNISMSLLEVLFVHMGSRTESSNCVFEFP